MAICATCGNDYDKAFTVSWNGQSETFDSVECAAAAATMFCCAHCAREAGYTDLADRAAG